MKKLTTSIAIASIFVVTSIFTASAMQINDQELVIGEYHQVNSFPPVDLETGNHE